MSKYQRKCSCTICKIEIPTQSLKMHYASHNREYKSTCIVCQAPTDTKFCSRSCSAKHNNTLRVPRIKPLKLTPFEVKEELFLQGLVSHRPMLRKLLAKQRGYKCETCELSTWQDKPITLIVDHKNGDASNNLPENVRLLCPNCNSQTPTFGGRNKGNGRKSRGLCLG